MFYHIIIERNEKNGKTGQYETLYQYDNPNLEEIISYFLSPYTNGEQFVFKGYPLEKKDIRRFAVKSSENTIKEIIEFKKSQSSMPRMFRKELIVENDEQFEDITIGLLKLYGKNDRQVDNKQKEIGRKVFIVHGHNETMKLEVARFIEQLGLNAIILHEQPNEGLTTIEKFEKFSNASFGIVLYSKCDIGTLKHELVEDENLKPRARQNVVFEHGYLISKLGRKNVAALVEDNDIELPSDISGILYIPYYEGDWKFKIAKELKSVGYEIDMNLVV